MVMTICCTTYRARYDKSMVDPTVATLHSYDAALRARQEKCAALTAQGMRAVDIARELGVTPHTVSKWRSDPDHAALVQAYQAATRSEAVAALANSVRDAVATLTGLMQGEGVPSAVQLRAACELLDRAGIVSKVEKDSNYSDLEAMAPSELGEQLAEAVRILGRTGT